MRWETIRFPIPECRSQRSGTIPTSNRVTRVCTPVVIPFDGPPGCHQIVVLMRVAFGVLVLVEEPAVVRAACRRLVWEYLALRGLRLNSQPPSRTPTRRGCRPARLGAQPYIVVARARVEKASAYTKTRLMCPQPSRVALAHSSSGNVEAQFGCARIRRLTCIR